MVTSSVAVDTEDDDSSLDETFIIYPKRRSSTGMTEHEERERRAFIKEIMEDQDLTPFERRRSIQSLMDGRRRSSDGCGADNNTYANHMSMAASAAEVAAGFYDSDDSDFEPRSSIPDEEDVDDDQDDNEDVDDEEDNTDDDELSDDQSSEISCPRVSRPDIVRSYSRQRISFRPKGRSASLKEYATDALALAAAVSASKFCDSDDPGDIFDSSERMEKCRPNCDHYERNCTIISPCCALAFGCRICHDDCPILPPPTDVPPTKDMSDNAQHKLTTIRKRLSLTMNFDQVPSHHTIDRFAISEVICRRCFVRQGSKTNNCVNCNIPFGEYYCATCNLWMASAEDPYHCDDCGFCRVGGRENFKHCLDCGMCVDSLLFDDHNCKTGKYMSNCPVCQEDLFSSRCASHEMPCGHAIHWHCFRELTSYDTRCPVCKKTAETNEQMASIWSAMAIGIALQPVPLEMARVVDISCTDCEHHDSGRRWHFLGVQCMQCSSFNTIIEKTICVGRDAFEFFGDQVDLEDDL